MLQSKFLSDREYVDSMFSRSPRRRQLNHPNIVQAYAVGEENGVVYFAMEYIRGETFKQILFREKVLDFKRAAKVISEIAGALDFAWKEQKLVHQDIKPDNIMLDANGFAKLADLGLARSATESVDEESDEVLGTPQYISPEQLTGVPTDVRSDIYSLGATFYQFVTGRFPYPADSPDEMAKLHVAGQLEPPKNVNPELPDELNTIIMKMMARKLDERYQTPEPLIKALDIYLRNYESRTGVPVFNLSGKRAGDAVRGGILSGPVPKVGTASRPAPQAVPAAPPPPLLRLKKGAPPSAAPAASASAPPPLVKPGGKLPKRPSVPSFGSGCIGFPPGKPAVPRSRRGSAFEINQPRSRPRRSGIFQRRRSAVF